MLLSMTGHGEAHFQQEGIAIAVEVRTVNSRYFKLSIRSGELPPALEPKIDSVVRKHIRRGTVQVGVRVDRTPSPDDYKLNQTVLASYKSQLEALYDRLHVPDSIHVEPLLALPGVVDERSPESSRARDEWPLIEQTLTEALENLANMRADEGRAMAADLKSNRESIARQLSEIEQLAPRVVELYRGRLRERINKWMGEFDIQVDAADLVREVGLFAERADISEEIVRLRSHLEQFDEMMTDQQSNGRKLDFLTQEMFRETNTIGSKANDAEIARHVIEIKAAIERMREMIQNIE